MKPPVLYYIRYILFILGIQALFNIAFLTVYHDLAEGAGLWDSLHSLLMGLKLDISLTGYVLIFPTFILILFSVWRHKILKIILGVYTFLIIVCMVPVYINNMVIYRYWKYPVDRSIFDYISTPGEMLASLPVLRVIILLILIGLIIYTLYFKVYLKWVATPLSWNKGNSGVSRWFAAGLFLILFPSLYLPVRGGMETSPVQTGSVYFHENIFLNHAAINPVWNLVYTMIEGDKLTQKLQFYPEEEVQTIMESLYGNDEQSLSVLTTARPNILMIILESFSQVVVDRLGGNGEPAPVFNGLVSEGLFFDRILAAGTMTDRALGAIFGGYPAMPGTSIIYYESKVEKLPGLNMVLKDEGYSSAFLYGGDIDFAHIRSFLVTGGFESIISETDFPNSIKRSSWGVPDHELFRRLLEENDKATEPFFHVALTLSSHSPFDVPMETVFPGQGDEVKFRNAVYYTDQSLGNFLDSAITREWWDQTLVIFIADHGYRAKNMTSFELDRFSVPMLWYGGALALNDTVISRYGSQTDLPATLLNQLDIPSERFTFSKNLLSAGANSFAYYTFIEGIGFATDSSFSVYDLNTRDYLVREGPGRKMEPDPGLAYLQYLCRDFNSR
jgi:phosphoglycerol transferase MdoB-like AlkP superfamily enzyme